MRNSCHYIDGEMRPKETEGLARSTLAEPASIHPSLHLLTHSKEAFLSLKIEEMPQITIFSPGGGKDPLLTCIPQVQGWGHLLRTRQRRDECEERWGEESCCEIPLSPFLI